MSIEKQEQKIKGNISLSGNYENNISSYINYIKQFPMLTKEKEEKIAQSWYNEKDPKAAEKLVNAHLRLVAKIASGYKGYNLPLIDLIGEGNLGMLKALNTFDPNKGFRFSTYAMWWIKASMQEYILKSWSLVKIGTTSAQKKLFFNLRKTKIQLELNKNEPLTYESAKKIAEKLNVNSSEVIDMNARLSNHDHSLNTTIQADNSKIQWIDWIEDETQNIDEKIISELESIRQKKLLKKAIFCLEKREKEILLKRRLLEKPKTLDVLSKEYGISRERIRQIEVQSLNKIKIFIKNHLFKESNQTVPTS